LFQAALCSNIDYIDGWLFLFSINLWAQFPLMDYEKIMPSSPGNLALGYCAYVLHIISAD